MTEADIEKSFCKKLTKLGWQCIKVGQDGWPDRLMLGPNGEVTFAEFKTSTGKLSKLQQERISWLHHNYHVAYVIRDNSDETLNRFLCGLE